VVESVLVVDDDAAFRDSIVSFLTALLPGAEIVAASDGNEAFTDALRLRPSYVLLDVTMPGPNGLNVANAIAQALPTTHIVILSGTDDVDLDSLPEAAGFIRKGAGMKDALRAALGQP
jgi:CheY-like chemotaxis protein